MWTVSCLSVQEMILDYLVAGFHQLQAFQNQAFLSKKEFHCGRQLQPVPGVPAALLEACLRTVALPASSHLSRRLLAISMCLSICLPTYLCFTQINLHFLWWTLTDRSASALSSFNRCILSSY